MLYSSLTLTGKSGDQWAIELSDSHSTPHSTKHFYYK